MGERVGRETDRDRGRETDRDRDRQTDRHTNKQRQTESVDQHAVCVSLTLTELRAGAEGKAMPSPPHAVLSRGDCGRDIPRKGVEGPFNFRC